MKCLEEKLDENYTMILHAFRTNPQNVCTVTYLPSHKPSWVAEIFGLFDWWMYWSICLSYSNIWITIFIFLFYIQKAQLNAAQERKYDKGECPMLSGKYLLPLKISIQNFPFFNEVWTSIIDTMKNFWVIKS